MARQRTQFRSPLAVPLGILAAAQVINLALQLSGLVRMPWWLVFAPAEVAAAVGAFFVLVLVALGQWGRS